MYIVQGDGERGHGLGHRDLGGSMNRKTSETVGGLTVPFAANVRDGIFLRMD